MCFHLSTGQQHHPSPAMTPSSTKPDIPGPRPNHQQPAVSTLGGIWQPRRLRASHTYQRPHSSQSTTKRVQGAKAGSTPQLWGPVLKGYRTLYDVSNIRPLYQDWETLPTYQIHVNKNSKLDKMRQKGMCSKIRNTIKCLRRTN